MHWASHQSPLRANIHPTAQSPYQVAILNFRAYPCAPMHATHTHGAGKNRMPNNYGAVPNQANDRCPWGQYYTPVLAEYRHRHCQTQRSTMQTHRPHKTGRHRAHPNDLLSDFARPMATPCNASNTHPMPSVDHPFAWCDPSTNSSGRT